MFAERGPSGRPPGARLGPASWRRRSAGTYRWREAAKLAGWRAGNAKGAKKVGLANGGKGKSGIRGVTWDTVTGSWSMSIYCMGTTAVFKRGFGDDDPAKEAAGRVAAAMYEA